MINNHLKHFISRYLTKDRSVPFHWLFHERWDSAFWKEYRRASLFDQSVNKKALSRVWVLSYSCSGTHNFTSRFHYMPGAFVFGENMFSNKSTDPLQFHFQVNKLRPAHWLFGSVFLQQGLQEKKGERLTHLFLLSNHFLKYQNNIDINAASERDHILIYLRNFIRVLFSQDKDSKKYNKPHFSMTDANFTSAVVNHRRRIDECLSLAERYEKKLTICFHEHFCAVPDRVLYQICDRVGLASLNRDGWNEPLDFFVRCYRNGRRPEIKNGELKCPVTKEIIYGKGGFYNPLPPIDLQRTITAPIRDWLPKERRHLLEHTFGYELVDFWLNDDTYDYVGTSTGELLKLLARSKK